MSTSKLAWGIRVTTFLMVLLLIGLEDVGQLPGTGVALLVIALGIPHGAADHLIYRARHPQSSTVRSLLDFSLYYLLLILAYALLWVLLPTVALVLFLAVSAYHFGQEQIDTRPASGLLQQLHSLLWGAFVLFFPIVLHLPDAQPIIERMVGQEIPLPDKAQRQCFLVVLVGANAYLAARRASLQQVTTGAQFRHRRFLDLILLVLLYLHTDLLMGFALFFLLWHSVPAAVSQWRYLRTHRLSGSVTGYLWQLSPLSLGAALTFVLVYHLWSESPGAGIDLGMVFIFISLITLPHALLVNAVYR